jgi:hypothetical protein
MLEALVFEELLGQPHHHIGGIAEGRRGWRHELATQAAPARNGAHFRVVDKAKLVAHGATLRTCLGLLCSASWSGPTDILPIHMDDF